MVSYPITFQCAGDQLNRQRRRRRRHLSQTDNISIWEFCNLNLLFLHLNILLLDYFTLASVSNCFWLVKLFQWDLLQSAITTKSQQTQHFGWSFLLISLSGCFKGVINIFFFFVLYCQPTLYVCCWSYKLPSKGV